MKKNKIFLYAVISLIAILSFGAYATENPYLNPYSNIQELENFAAAKLAENGVVYQGNQDYSNLVKKYNFKDVSGTNKAIATKMAALGITLGTGNNNFSPNSQVMNIEALVMIMRAIGAEEKVLSDLRANQNIGDAGVQKKYNDAIVDEAILRGVMVLGESFDYFKGVNTQTLKKWINLGFKIPAKTGEIDNDKRLDEIINSNVKNSENISRIELSKVLSAVVDIYAQGLGYKTDRALVIGVENVTEEGAKFKDIWLQNSKGEVQKIRLNSEPTNTTGFAVFGTNLTNHESLSINDECELILKNNKVVLAIKRDLSVRSEIVANLSATPDIVIYQGKVRSNLAHKLNTQKELKEQDRITIELYNDKMVDIVYSKDLKRNVLDGFLILKNAKFITPASINFEDEITLYTKDGKLLYVVVGLDVSKNIKGNIKSVEMNEDGVSGKITIFGFDDVLTTLDIDNISQVYVNLYRATLSDIKVGAVAEAFSQYGKIITLKTDSYNPQAGYIAKRSRIQFGVVDKIDGDSVYLNSPKTSFTIDDTVKFFKESRGVKRSDLKLGDHVKLYFDDIYTQYPSRVEIEGSNSHVYRIIKGKINNFNQFNQNIEIAEISDFKNVGWIKQSLPYHERFKLALDATIYDNFEFVDKKLFNMDAVNREAYFVIRDNFGSKEIARVVFKTGSEKNFTESIAGFDAPNKYLTLKGAHHIKYNDETVFIQNSRIVGESALKSNSSVVIVGNKSGDYDNLKIALIHDDNRDIFKDFYVGTLEEVNLYRVSFSNYANSIDYGFSDFGTDKIHFTLSDESVIYDLDKNIFLTPKELFNKGYSKDENYEKDAKWLKYKRYYAIFNVEGNEIKTMTLRKRGLFKGEYIDEKARHESEIPEFLARAVENVYYTQGEISLLNDKWKRISLTNSFNYLTALNEWRANSKDTSVELDTALILKNGKSIEYKDLKLGDRLNIMRIGYKALYIIVE